ncbi:hypothetical protein SELMODRAFT_403402 [Selaginella moellendorffii]|uniref:RRM domain-containing protein n=1 Tax=Selaginella moellendorffii TaxID=88036 RepID=D8QRA7_SELML|nr:hypothetical protein SELMODRAFT_403402 [Selaginella moellendorffii]
MPDLPKAVAARFFEPAATAQAPDFFPGPAIKERSYSLVVRGLSKKHTCPEALQELADDILRKRFRFFPPCDDFVEKVFYCLHVEGDMAILVFYTELMAELLFQVCRDETSSPFSIAGKRFALERLYTANRQFEGHGNNVVNAVRSLEASSKFVYLSGLPPSWEDGDKLEAHFSGVLNRDLTSKVVGSVHVFPAAAYVEFTDRAAVEKLFYSCKLDGSITSDIDQNLVICCGVRTLPLSQEPFQVSEESDVSPASQQCRQRTARNLEERGWEKTGNENSFEQQIREETEKLSSVQQQESPGGLRSKNTKVRDCPSMQSESSLEQQGRQKGSNLEQQNREEPDKLSSVQQQESPTKTKNTKVRDRPSTEKQRSVRFDLGHAAQGKQQDRVPEARPLARVTSNIDRQVQHMQGHSGAGQRQVAERGLHQVSIMLGGFQRETFDSEQLKKLLVGLFRKHKNYTSEADLKFQVKWDAAADGGRVIFSSEDMANRLMEIYVRATEEFSLDDLKFSLFRPEGYQRPRAAYKTGASSSIYKVLQFDGCRVCPVAERQFRCALAEALATGGLLLCNTRRAGCERSDEQQGQVVCGWPGPEAIPASRADNSFHRQLAD